MPAGMPALVRQEKLIRALQVGSLPGKVEPDHPERNPAWQEVTNVMKPGERRQQAVIRKGEGEMVPKSIEWRVPRFRPRSKATRAWAIVGEARSGSSGLQATACWTEGTYGNLGGPMVSTEAVVGRDKWGHP